MGLENWHWHALYSYTKVTLQSLKCTKYSSYWNIAPGCEMLSFRI